MALGIRSSENISNHTTEAAKLVEQTVRGIRGIRGIRGLRVMITLVRMSYTGTSPSGH